MPGKDSLSLYAARTTQIVNKSARKPRKLTLKLPSVVQFNKHDEVKHAMTKFPRRDEEREFKGIHHPK